MLVVVKFLTLFIVNLDWFAVAVARLGTPMVSTASTVPSITTLAATYNTNLIATKISKLTLSLL